MFFLKKSSAPHHTALAMTGAKPGHAIVVLGADGPLAGAIGHVTGLNGRTVVVDRADGLAARVQAAAAAAGALVEFVDALPATTTLETATFDIAVVRAGLTTRSPADRTAIATEAWRLVREGGRIVVIEGSTRTGLFRRRRREVALDVATVTTLLSTAGARAIRQLAQTEGVLYVEGRR